MDARPLPLVYLAREPLMPPAPGHKPPMLLLLHGVGSHERDLFGLASALDPRFLILSLRAPNVIGPDSYAWFTFTPAPGVNRINANQEEASRQLLLRVIPEAVAAYGADPARVYLMGFSQGAIMSASVTLTRPDLVAGAVLMSGRILPEIKPLIAPAEALRGLPILVVHGTRDSMLPITHGHASRETLSTLPVALTYREYDMPHTITDASLADIAAWLTARLNEDEPRQ
ncbi:MAG TPA: alpha/beta fold hydrolase [Ktedonobacterales bacterium]|nr:alpha/beta fold hydrolase [Ktedonobacterales bacterium]